MVKTFKNLILWNQKADDFETWYAALVTRVLPSIFKWLWVDLDLHVFYIKVKIGPFCFCMGKCLSCRFPRNPRSRPFIDTQIRHFQTSFPQKHLSRLKPNFLWSLHWMLGWKFNQMFRVTWPRWLPMPYMVKTFKNILLRNQETDVIETWYKASSTVVLPNWFKLWHWVDLVHFYDMVKFVS